MTIIGPNALLIDVVCNGKKYPVQVVGGSGVYL